MSFFGWFSSLKNDWVSNSQCTVFLILINFRFLNGYFFFVILLVVVCWCFWSLIFNLNWPDIASITMRRNINNLTWVYICFLNCRSNFLSARTKLFHGSSAFPFNQKLRTPFILFVNNTRSLLQNICLFITSMIFMHIVFRQFLKMVRVDRKLNHLVLKPIRQHNFCSINLVSTDLGTISSQPFPKIWNIKTPRLLEVAKTRNQNSQILWIFSTSQPKVHSFVGFIHIKIHISDTIKIWIVFENSSRKHGHSNCKLLTVLTSDQRRVESFTNILKIFRRIKNDISSIIAIQTG